MRFDEWYPKYIKRGIVQRKCECIGCQNMTFWRYDYTERGERLFFAACSSECLEAVLKAGLRQPTENIIVATTPRANAEKAIRQLGLM